jgi:hypothetical protein
MRKKQNKDCATNIAHFREDCANSEQSTPIESGNPFKGAGQKNIDKLQHHRRQKSLSLCLELLEKQGISGDAAVFVLGQVGGEA